MRPFRDRFVDAFFNFPRPPLANQIFSRETPAHSRCRIRLAFNPARLEQKLRRRFFTRHIFREFLVVTNTMDFFDRTTATPHQHPCYRPSQTCTHHPETHHKSRFTPFYTPNNPPTHFLHHFPSFHDISRPSKIIQTFRLFRARRAPTSPSREPELCGSSTHCVRSQC